MSEREELKRLTTSTPCGVSQELHDLWCRRYERIIKRAPRREKRRARKRRGM